MPQTSAFAATAPYLDRTPTPCSPRSPNWPRASAGRAPMPRETTLDSLLFPVVQEKLYSLRADSEDELRPIEHHSAIIRRDTGKVLGVVGRYYQLVTHA